MHAAGLTFLVVHGVSIAWYFNLCMQDREEYMSIIITAQNPDPILTSTRVINDGMDQAKT